MTNNELKVVLERILFDLDTKAYDEAKNTLKTLLSLLKCQNELNEFKRIVYEKMQFYNTRDKVKNKALYELYQNLKKISSEDFDFASYYIKYIEIIK